MTRRVFSAVCLLLCCSAAAIAAPASDAELSRLLVGQWESPRRIYCYWEDGTWRLSPESGTSGGRWQIKQGRLVITHHDGVSTTYHIIVLDDKRLVTRNHDATFKHKRVVPR